ncbi:hypothetical protein GV792_22555 [Nocardia cyriacigeorgica]|uniref:Mce protein n=1 Tax=Nocardia cyriacigeorgica TaxID=135487 RepID=A0A6P1D4U9_9NOCA|nr:hypothetical protein [Nocardia cyriacigeorgica]NEW44434.1 hypothetical protein [Nocardia cyriacigeorgica]NEW52816.1 hypothetical protein [Nocardia cyriacigeorgica]
MSDTNGVRSRARRRAVRSEGPPPDEVGVDVRVDHTTVSPAQQPAEEKAPTTEPAESPRDPAVDESAVDPADAGEVVAESAETSTETAADADTETGAQTPVKASDSAEAGARWQRVVAVAAVVLAVAMLAGSAYIMNLRGDIADQQTRRADYVQTAKQALLNITSISAETAEADINRVLEVSAGDLATEYEQRKADYAGIVKKAEVRAKGKVIDAAIESSDDHSAIVLVAVEQTLTNGGADGQQQRQYRFRVTVSDTDKGLAATRMEMVV